MGDRNDRNGNSRRTDRQTNMMIDYLLEEDKKEMAFEGDLSNPLWIELGNILNRYKTPTQLDRPVESWQLAWKNFKKNNKTKVETFCRTGQGKTPPSASEFRVYYAELNYTGPVAETKGDSVVDEKQKNKAVKPKGNDASDTPVLKKKLKKGNGSSELESNSKQASMKKNFIDTDDSDEEQEVFKKKSLPLKGTVRTSYTPKYDQTNNDTDDSSSDGVVPVKKILAASKKPKLAIRPAPTHISKDSSSGNSSGAIKKILPTPLPRKNSHFSDIKSKLFESSDSESESEKNPLFGKNVDHKSRSLCTILEVR